MEEIVYVAVCAGGIWVFLRRQRLIDEALRKQRDARLREAPEIRRQGARFFGVIGVILTLIGLSLLLMRGIQVGIR